MDVGYRAVRVFYNRKHSVCIVYCLFAPLYWAPCYSASEIVGFIIIIMVNKYYYYYYSAKAVIVRSVCLSFI